MKPQITYDQFEKIDIRLGTVLTVKKNEKARKPSLVVEVDFGKNIGVKMRIAGVISINVPTRSKIIFINNRTVSGFSLIPMTTDEKI